MIRSVTPKLVAYLTAGLGLLGLAALTGRPEVAFVAMPLVAAVILGTARAGSPDVRVHLHLDDDRLVEGDVTTLELTISSSQTVANLEIAATVPSGLEALSPNPIAVALLPGQPAQADLRLRPCRWGVYQLGDLTLHATDDHGLFSFDGEVSSPIPLRVFPTTERLARVAPPLETQALLGSHAARAVGSGIEFAGIRPLGPGESARELNWRATMRRGTPHVTERHAERAGEVVLFLDTFSDVGLDVAVRAAATLANEYLRERDRVGVVGFGGTVRWLRAGMGLAQQYRIAETLIDTRVFASFAWKDVAHIPRQVVPPRALVVALSPLTDERALVAMAGLRLRGCDVVLVALAIEELVPPRPDEVGRLAHRLWRMQLQQRRADFQAMGMTVVEWPAGKSVGAVMHEARLARTRPRRRPGA